MELEYRIELQMKMESMYLQFSTDLGVTTNYWISSLLLIRKPLNLF